MEPREVEELIEAGFDDATVDVTRPRGPDDDDHYAAVVIAPEFDGESLVDRHQLVYDALGEHMTTDIHAIELSTYTPEEYDQQ
jgi:stress-induced morphogen